MNRFARKRGRPAQPYQDPRQTALEARMRHTGLPKELAAKDLAGSVIGRLRLAGKITEPQYEASNRYHKDYAEAMAALLGPEGLERTHPGAAADEPTEEYIAWATAATMRFRTTNARLTANELRAIERTIILDLDPGPMLMELRGALTCCAKGYGLVENGLTSGPRLWQTKMARWNCAPGREPVPGFLCPFHMEQRGTSAWTAADPPSPSQRTKRLRSAKPRT